LIVSERNPHGAVSEISKISKNQGAWELVSVKFVCREDNRVALAIYNRDGEAAFDKVRLFESSKGYAVSLKNDMPIGGDEFTDSTLGEEAPHEHSYTTETFDATCTVDGKIVYTCTECGDTYEEPIKAEGHKAGDWEVVTEATTTADGLKVQKCSVCGETLEEKVIPRVLVIKNQTLSLESNISILFRVDPTYFTANGYTNPVMIFTFNDEEFRVTDFVVNSKGLNEYTFSEAAPHQMKMTVTAVISAEYEGEVYYSAPVEYSIFEYCNKQINKYWENPDAAKTVALLVDILNYGAAAQIYVQSGDVAPEALANAELTDAQKAIGYQGDIEYVSEKDMNKNPIEGGIADMKSVGLTLQDSVTMNIKFELFEGQSLEGVTAVVKAAGLTWEIDSSEFYLSGNRWVIDFKGLNPAQMREAVQVTLYKDGVVVSDTAQYSVETYGTSNISNAYLADLVEAMSKYGRSAYAYLYN
jgi:hypothetical protein